MLKIISLVLLFCINFANAETIVGTVSRVKDGDTFVLKGHSVRLYGINAPEKNQIGGSAATNYLRQLVKNQIVYCTRNGRDKYGRFLGVCKINNKQDISEIMVKKGYAKPFMSKKYIAKKYIAKNFK